MTIEKQSVHDFWGNSSCGEDKYFRGTDARQQFLNQSMNRYSLEPYIIPLANFTRSSQKRVLEFGVGLDANHQQYAQFGAELSGCDLTEYAVAYTQQHLHLLGLVSNLRVAYAENLPYADGSFDWVYSWGVIHHSPNILQAIQEIKRVPVPSSEARVMIYHKNSLDSLVGYRLWLRYALAFGRPFLSLAFIHANYPGSPGTKAYTVAESRQLFNKFSRVKIDTVLTHDDLLSSQAGQRHEGLLLTIARRVFSRRFIKWLLPKHCLFILIKATN